MLFIYPLILFFKVTQRIFGTDGFAVPFAQFLLPARNPNV